MTPSPTPRARTGLHVVGTFASGSAGGGDAPSAVGLVVRLPVAWGAGLWRAACRGGVGRGVGGRFLGDSPGTDRAL